MTYIETLFQMYHLYLEQVDDLTMGCIPIRDDDPCCWLHEMPHQSFFLKLGWSTACIGYHHMSRVQTETKYYDSYLARTYEPFSCCLMKELVGVWDDSLRRSNLPNMIIKGPLFRSCNGCELVLLNIF